MRPAHLIIYILTVSSIFSCNSSPQQNSSAVFTDSVSEDTVNESYASVHADEYMHENRPEPILYSTGAADTTMYFDFNDDGGSEGAGAEVRYKNDSIKEADWTIYGGTGQVRIKYTFTKDGLIRAKQRSYNYKRGISNVRSDKDIVLTDSFSYTMRTDGSLTTPVNLKDFQNMFPEFKAIVPFFLLPAKTGIKDEVKTIENYFKKTIPTGPGENGPEIPYVIIGNFMGETLTSFYDAGAHSPAQAIQRITNTRNEQFFVVKTICGAGGFCGSYHLLMFDAEGRFVKRRLIGKENGDLGFSDLTEYKIIADTLRIYRIYHDNDEDGVSKKVDTTIHNILLKV
jgi:hypothetical protein